VWEVPGGSNTPVVIDSAGAGVTRDLAVDPAGNVYAVGDQPVSRNGYEWTVRKGSFSVSTGRWAFATLDQVAASAASVAVVTATVNGAPSTSVYVVGTSASTSTWTVRRSTNGGPWSTVDSYHYGSAGGSSHAYGVTGDASGNVYVVGWAKQGTLTGYDKHHNPIYSYTTHWVVRESTGGSWGVADDYVAPYGANYNAVCTDPAGHVYVAADVYDANGYDHAVVRSNASGSWATSGDFTGSGSAGQGWYYGITSDPSGNVYAGGGEIDGSATTWTQSWMIRSQPAAPTNLTAAPDAASPSSQIDLSWTNTAGTDETGFAIYRSTDGINFTLIGTTAAGVTSYNDSGLSAGTLYDYYVITLLNGAGSSGPSNTAGGTTGA
jgi:hypothetical protein